MAELGAGGGQGDLDQQHELELDDSNTIGSLISLCALKMQGEPKLRERVIQMLLSIMDEHAPAIALDTAALHAANSDIVELEDTKLEDLVPALVKMATTMQERKAENAILLRDGLKERPAPKIDGLPKRIVNRRLPYRQQSRTLADYFVDFPLFKTLLLYRAMLPHRSFQTQGHTSMHSRPCPLGAESLDGLPVRPSVHSLASALLHS